MDIGLTGRIVGGIPPVPRYNVVLGLVYDLCGCGEGSGVPCVQQPIRPVEPARPPQGDILGRVVDASTRLPLPGARITYPQHTRTDQLTGPDGVFQSYDFPPGPVRVEVTADGYVPGAYQVPVPRGTVRFSFPLKPEGEAPPPTVPDETPAAAPDSPADGEAPATPPPPAFDPLAPPPV